MSAFHVAGRAGLDEATSPGWPGTPGPVDVHTHAVPRSLLVWLAQRGLADLSGEQRGSVFIDPRVSNARAGTHLPFPAEAHQVPARLAQMDRMGVAAQVVSLAPYLTCARSDDPVLVREVIRRGNDALADFISVAPGRLLGLGSVPLGQFDAAEEARRCLEDLGMGGIAVGSQGAGRDLDDPVNDELFALLAGRAAFTSLHPSGVPDAYRMRDFDLPKMVGYPMEVALAVSRLLFGGVLERHRLVLCVANGGGCLPALRGRLDAGWSRFDAARTTSRPPSELLDRLYYDTATFSAAALRQLVAEVGADHVLLGSDAPLEPFDADPVQTLNELGLDPGSAARVRAATAVSLLTAAR